MSSLDWDQPDAPVLSRFRKERLPHDEALFVNGLGAITSFMAREGITDLGEGFGEFLAHAERFHDQKGQITGQGFHGYVADKVVLKGRNHPRCQGPQGDRGAAERGCGLAPSTADGQASGSVVRL